LTALVASVELAALLFAKWKRLDLFPRSSPPYSVNSSLGDTHNDHTPQQAQPLEALIFLALGFVSFHIAAWI
jgi:hypothetical protein